MKKWIVCMLSALFLMPVGQLCAESNIFIAETVGRHTFISLNSQLQIRPFYDVTLRNVPNFAESVTGVRPARGAVIAFPWTQDAGLYKGRLYRRDANWGYNFPADVHWSGEATTVQMTAGLGPVGIEQESIELRINPRMLVETQSASGAVFLRSALEITDKSFSDYDAESLLTGVTVFTENMFTKTFYGWGAEEAGIYTCPLNTQTGLFSTTSGCSFLPVDEAIKALIVSPSFDALWALTDSGDALVWQIMPDGSINNAYRIRVRFVGADSVDEIALTPSPRVGLLASSATGMIYSFPWRLGPFSLSAPVSVDVDARKVDITYSGSLVDMLTPQFEDTTHFATAVGNTMVGCHNSSSNIEDRVRFTCNDIVTLDQEITSITPAISHGTNYQISSSLPYGSRYRPLDRVEITDSWVVGLSGVSDDYASNVLTVTATHRGEEFTEVDLQQAITTPTNTVQEGKVVAIALY